MPYTPERIAKLHKKLAETPDALKRDPLKNYLEGWFFVTLNTRDKVPLLSTCEGSPGIADGQPGAPRCRYTELGAKVKECWQTICNFHPQVVVDDCEVMPEHFHGLLYLPHGNDKHLGRIIYGFMVGCTHAYWDSLGIDWRNMKSGEGDAAASNKWQDRDHTRSYRGPALFVHGYNDVEPITPEQVQIKRDYIRDQARKRLIQGDRHQCFRIERHRHSRNWTAARIDAAIGADPFFARNPEKRESAVRNILARLNTGNTGANALTPQSSTPTHQPSTLTPQSSTLNPQSSTLIHQSSTLTPHPSTIPQSSTFHPSLLSKGSPLGEVEGALGAPAIMEVEGAFLDFLGAPAIMAAERKLPLICHRADAARFEEQKAKVLEVARSGAVIVSAFISPKERDIRTQLMVERLPFVEIMDNGFSERYKPAGKAFYAVAENRLVQITPWAYQYQKDGVQVSREMCLVMNELARVISGTAEDWWKD